MYPRLMTNFSCRRSTWLLKSDSARLRLVQCFSIAVFCLYSSNRNSNDSNDSNGKNSRLCRGCSGIMEKKRETCGMVLGSAVLLAAMVGNIPRHTSLR